jgi:hypothetical protein
MLYRKTVVTNLPHLAIYESLTKEFPLRLLLQTFLTPFSTGKKKWIDSKSIGEVRHIRWHLSKPTTKQDLSDSYNWRTDAKIATAGILMI